MFALNNSITIDLTITNHTGEMTYNPLIHHRRSIRIRNYDYSQPGAYFVTICAQNKKCLWGKIVDNAIHLNDAGRMIEKWWNRLPSKSSVELDAYVIMPNHLHGILVLAKTRQGESEPSQGAPMCAPLQSEQSNGRPISEIIKWFKTMTTNDYLRGVKQHGWPRFDGKLWQRNYYEHIIRNEKSLDEIRQYVENNPAQWALDGENPKNI